MEHYSREVIGFATHCADVNIFGEWKPWEDPEEGKDLLTFWLQCGLDKDSVKL